MRESAEFLGVDYDTLRGYVNHGLIPTVRYPSLAKGKRGEPRRKKMIRFEVLQKFILEHESVEGAAGRTESCTKNVVQTTRNYRKGWYEDGLAKRSK